MATHRSMLIVASVICAVVGACVLTGCGDDRNYPEGFLAEAAKDETALASTAKAPSSGTGSSGAAAKAASGPRGDAPKTASATAASEPSVPAASDVVSEAAPAAAPIDEAAVAAVVESVAVELKLPPPPDAQVAPGEEPFQKLARSSKFDAFRTMSARYIQLRAELLPYGMKLADGSATPEERRMHNRIEEAMNLEFKRINAYMWESRFSEEDRAAMGWILYGGMQPK